MSFNLHKEISFQEIKNALIQQVQPTKNPCKEEIEKQLLDFIEICKDSKELKIFFGTVLLRIENKRGPISHSDFQGLLEDPIKVSKIIIMHFRDPRWNSLIEEEVQRKKFFSEFDLFPEIISDVHISVLCLCYLYSKESKIELSMVIPINVSFMSDDNEVDLYAKFLAAYTKNIFSNTTLRGRPRISEVDLRRVYNFYLFNYLIIIYKFSLVKNGVFDHFKNKTPSKLGEPGFFLDDQELDEFQNTFIKFESFLEKSYFKDFLLNSAVDVSLLKSESGNRYVKYRNHLVDNNLDALVRNYLDNVASENIQNLNINFLMRADEEFPNNISKVEFVNREQGLLSGVRLLSIPLISKLIVLIKSPRVPRSSTSADHNLELIKKIHPKFISELKENFSRV